METNNNKNIQEFEIDKLVIDTHNKIATWHNGDANNLSLKFLSFDIVEKIAGAVFEHLGLDYNQELKLDDEAKEKLKEAKKELQYNKKSDELSDIELYEEVEKRKLKNKYL